MVECVSYCDIHWAERLSVFFDMPLEKLKIYMPERSEPSDIDSFWQDSIAQARTRSGEPEFCPIDLGHRTVDTFDLTFGGSNGQPIKG